MAGKYVPLVVTPAPSRCSTMKVSETDDGGKPSRKEGNAVSTRDQLVSGHENRKRVLVLGDVPAPTQHPFFWSVLVFALVPLAVHPFFLCACIFPYLLS